MGQCAGSLRRGGGLRETAAVADEEKVVDYLVFAEDNPSSIRNCIELARTNARAVRTALTAEMWDAINGAWIELKRYLQARANSSHFDRVELTRFLDFVKKASLDYDGAAHRTMLRNDAYWFSRLGLYIERADNTARILDVKYNILLPQTETIGGSLDYFQWASILRAVSALTAYHWVYRTSLKPWLIADLLILRIEMPRSLIACYDNIVRFLDFDRTGLRTERHRASAGASDHGAAVKIIDERNFPIRPARIRHRLRRGQRPPRHDDLPAISVRIGRFSESSERCFAPGRATNVY